MSYDFSNISTSVDSEPESLRRNLGSVPLLCTGVAIGTGLEEAELDLTLGDGSAGNEAFEMVKEVRLPADNSAIWLRLLVDLVSSLSQSRSSSL